MRNSFNRKTRKGGEALRKYYLLLPIILFISSIILFSSERGSVKANSLKTKVSISKMYGKIPLYFIKNRGQFDRKALFYSRTKDYTLWVTKKGLVFDKIYKDKKKNKREVLKMNFIRPEKGVKVELGKVEEYKVNYFKGNDKSKWITGIETSKDIIYRGIYKNIDLKVYGKGNLIEYDWIVKRGGNPEDIEFEYRGSKNIKIDKEGNIVIKTGFGKIIHKKPYSYQVIDGKKIEIKSKYYKIGKNRYGIKTGKYNKNYSLIIDPVSLVYSTYLGGSEFDIGLGIAVDNNGYAYVTGETISPDFPTENPYQSSQTSVDAFVTKFSQDGSTLIYSTYLGGDNTDYGHNITVDTQGHAYIAGHTSSSDFPTENPYNRNYRGSSDGFVTKLSQDGSTLVYSTYLGGSNIDYLIGIAVDSSGYAYVTGYTSSSNFPTKNAYQSNYRGNYDTFVTKLSQDGSSLVYSTYLGSDDADYGIKIAVDSSGYAYIEGFTDSSDFPTKNPYQTDQGGRDVFVTKLSQDGSSLVYSTYLGGSSDEEAYDIAVDTQGYTYVTGYTDSSDFPTQNPYQIYQGGSDVFVTKLSQEGNSLIYSTYLGGSNDEEAYGIAIDTHRYAYITGYTDSSNFPTENPYQTDQGGEDVFVTKLSQEGNSLIYSTYLGGSNDEEAFGIAVDTHRYAYVTGYTDSSNFPTENPYQTNYKGNMDAFATKLNFSSDLSIEKIVSDSNPVIGDNITYMLKLRNNGPNDAGDIIAIDNLPSGVVYVSSNPSQGTYDYQSGRWNIGSLSNGRTATLTITVKVNQGGTITNTASIVGYDISDTNLRNNRSSADIIVGYTVRALVEGGGGSVSPATQRVSYGGTATIKISPEVGYEIKSIHDNGVLRPISNPYIIKNVRENHRVVVRFKRMVTLTLSGERKTERAWIIRRDYGKLTLNIEDPGNAATKFIIQKSTEGGVYQDIKSINSSEITGGTYIYYDKYLEKGKTYKYRFIAYDSTGTILAVSNEIEL